MKFVLTSWGSRGEVEPCSAVGRELLARGHDVCMAVPPDLAGIPEAAGLATVAYGPDFGAILDAYREFWTTFFGSFWKLQDLAKFGKEMSEPLQYWDEMSRMLTSLASGADLLFTTPGFEMLVANVADYHDIPLATLHWSPLRPNGQLYPFVPAPLGRAAMMVRACLSRGGAAKKVEQAQRRELRLPEARGSWPRRIIERGTLEIQAYDEVCFPGLAAEWAKWNGQRPFVGALTLELPTADDQEVASWIAAGTPPIFFGFGSVPVAAAGDTLAVIGAACEELGERALVGAAGTDFTRAPHFDHVKVVDTLNYGAVFPACRAVVHRGSSGITAAGLRAGVPTLILSTDLYQTLSGTHVKRLKVGTARRFAATTRESLIEDLRTILSPAYVAAARELATRMTKPEESAVKAADLLENFARSRRSAGRRM
ncbi:MAG: glycosyltransferase [Mycobacteriaceae bacterium]|nr:glycosyltransferase [Mycobacteriaceae bacterium]